MTHQSKPPATPIGAIDINGAAYLRNVKGDLVAIANVKPQTLIAHEMVHRIARYAEDLSAEIARFAAHAYADIGAYDALLAQEYGVERPQGRGNRQVTTFDGQYQVSVKVQDLTDFGPELQMAKELLDAIIRDRSVGADPFLVTLVAQAFQVDKKGKVDAHRIRAVRSYEVDDPRWPDVVRAIDAAEVVRETKRYLNVHRRDGDGVLKLIPLDIATAKVRPEDAWRRSLRRQAAEAVADIAAVRAEVEAACERAGLARPRATTAADAVRWLIDAQAEATQGAVSQALENLDVAMTYLLDGAPVSAARCIADAADALGGDLRDDAEEYKQMIAERMRKAGIPTASMASVANANAAEEV